jgi:serine/threonine-protein kinase
VATKRLDEIREDEQGRAQTLALWPDVADRTSGLRVRQREATQPQDLISGTYRLLGPLGDTSYGRAYRAEHVALEREVALHFLAPGIVSERVMARELPLAVAQCAQLAHPNVISVREHGRTEGPQGLYYVVTDAIEGIALGDHLHMQGRLSVDEALSLARQIGRALRAAHKLGIVHGDLRPSNVRVIATDDGLLVKVMGFGRIPLVRGDAEPSTHVRSVASPAYAAPELARGAQVDGRADIYALGVILFRMIAGRAPYTGPTPLSVSEAHAHAPIPSLRDWVGPEVPPELDAIVTRCLAKSPADRFPDIVSCMTAMRLLTLGDSAFLSRDASEVTTSQLRGVQSILPTLPPTEDTTGANAAALHERREWALHRMVWIALSVLVLLAILGELVLLRSRDVESPPAKAGQSTD